MIAPPTLLIVGVIGGLGAAATYGTFHYAEKLGPKLSATDLLPMPPPYPPVPRFFYNKELMESLRRR
ncbi:hypothetical protein ES703_16017 [subsurface metagenome]